MIDPDGNIWSYTYDADGDQTTVTDPTGNLTTAAFDADGEPVAKTSGRRETTSYDYDSLGDLIKVTDSLGNVSKTGYDGNQMPVSITDPNGNLTALDYNPDDQLTTVHRADGTTLAYGYDAGGNQTSYTNGAGKTSTYLFDPLNRVSEDVDPLGRVTSYAYDPVGNLISTTDPAEDTTTNSYDAANQLTSVSYSDGITPSVTYTYDADGRRKTMVDETGTTRYSYDSLNRLTSVTNGAGQRVGYSYDLADNLTGLTYPNGKMVTRGFDKADRLTSVTDWNNNTTNFGYNADGALNSEAFANDVTTTFRRDANDATTSIIDTLGTSMLASFGYIRDGNSQVTAEIHAAAQQGNQAYTYNSLNQLATRNTRDYSYNSAGDPTQLDNGASMSYDDADQATSYTSPTGDATTLDYDADGDRLNGLTSDGLNATYGYDQAGRMTRSTRPSNAPVISGGAGHNLEIRPGGLLAAWGDNAFGQLGDGTTTDRLVPTTLAAPTNVVTVAAGFRHSLAVDDTGTVWAWGDNSNGQLGDGTTTDKLTPVNVTAAAGAVEVAAGNSFSLALMPNGTVEAWGANAYGQLGDGTTTDRHSPVTIAGLSNVIAIGASGSHAVALKSDGTVWAWGDNSNGQLGDGTTTDEHSPIRCGTKLTGVIGIDTAANGNDTFALLANGTVRGWGQNNHGQLGDGTTTDRHLPKTVPGMSNVVAIAAGAGHTLAVEADGSVWAWGNNNQGQLAQPATLTQSTTPVQVTGFIGSDDITAGGNHSIVVKQNGTIWAFGENDSGQLGNNTTTDSNIPVHAAGVTNPTVGSAVMGYAYDGDGLRASVTSGTTVNDQAWDQQESTPLLLTDGTETYVYGPGGLPIEQVDADGTTTYLHGDQYGSIRLLTDLTGAVTGTYDYTPNGRLEDRSGTATTPLMWGGQYQDHDSGLYYLRARYYDPTTAQFITRDPVESITGQAYQYAAGDPLDLSDPSGRCIGPDWLCRAANDVWHPVRFAATLPVSATARAADAGYELVTQNDVSCHWNSTEWVDVCSGGPTIFNAPATTFGSVVNTDLNYCDFMSANNDRLIGHEAKHADQWSIFGPGFAVLDTAAAGVGWGISKFKGGDPGRYNIFEIWAGLKDGGYE